MTSGEAALAASPHLETCRGSCLEGLALGGMGQKEVYENDGERAVKCNKMKKARKPNKTKAREKTKYKPYGKATRRETRKSKVKGTKEQKGEKKKEKPKWRGPRKSAKLEKKEQNDGKAHSRWKSKKRGQTRATER